MYIHLLLQEKKANKKQVTKRFRGLEDFPVKLFA